jgi:anti-sigma regulatory factor (Ser/Thr protein kinase)
MAREIIGSVVPPLRPGTTDDVLLLTSEVVSNAIRHGAKEPSQEIVLRLERGEHNVRVEVVNDGPGFTPSPPFQPTEERDGGYGLYLVNHLARSWGVDREGDRTSVWFDVADTAVDDA